MQLARGQFGVRESKHLAEILHLERKILKPFCNTIGMIPVAHYSFGFRATLVQKNTMILHSTELCKLVGTAAESFTLQL